MHPLVSMWADVWCRKYMVIMQLNYFAEYAGLNHWQCQVIPSMYGLLLPPICCLSFRAFSSILWGVDASDLSYNTQQAKIV